MFLHEIDYMKLVHCYHVHINTETSWNKKALIIFVLFIENFWNKKAVIVFETIKM